MYEGVDPVISLRGRKESGCLWTMNTPCRSWSKMLITDSVQVSTFLVENLGFNGDIGTYKTFDNNLKMQWGNLNHQPS